MPRPPKPPLSESQILQWADAYHAKHGKYPTEKSGPVQGSLDEKWRNIDNALRYGLRGFPGGSSLAKLFAAVRGHQHKHQLPPLTEEQILKWAQDYITVHGKHPTEDSGPIADTRETWQGVNAALSQGMRGLLGTTTLAKLLADRLGVRTQIAIPQLTVELILQWADNHFEKHGKYPDSKSGDVVGVDGETWKAINTALEKGARGLPNSSLAKLLAEHRGKRNRSALPDLREEDIVRWALAYKERTGELPSEESGPIADSGGETWKFVGMALYEGRRGMPGKETVRMFLVRHRCC